MFIKKLTRKDIAEIIKTVMDFDDEILTMVKVDNFSLVRYSNNWNEYVINIYDFEINIEINAFNETRSEHQNKFRSFMLGKFGDKYKQSFKKYEEEMIK